MTIALTGNRMDTMFFESPRYASINPIYAGTGQGPMKVYSVNFLLKGKTPYKDLAPVFPDILKMLLEDIGQMPEEEEILQMLIDLNVADLEENRKPEGYNRKGKVRLVFPMESNEFYIKTYSKSQDLSHIADNISNMLTAAGVKFSIEQNMDVEFN